MIEKVLNFVCTVSNAHVDNVVAVRMKVGSDVAGPFTQLGGDFPVDLLAFPTGSNLVDFPMQVSIEVPYGPVDFYFICVAVNEQGIESAPSTPPVQYSSNESFGPPVLVMV